MTHLYVWHKWYRDPHDLTSKYIVSPCVWKDSFIMCDITCLCVRHESHFETWCRLCMRHDSLVCATWFVRMCDMTFLYVRHDSFVCATLLIRMCDMTHSYVCHDSFVCLTTLICMCNMTHSMCDMNHSMCDTTHLYAQPDLFISKSSCWRNKMTI